MQHFEFSEDEIESVCLQLGIPKDSFADKASERRKIIDHWGNANIIACPGSGKTTVLLTKLLLLARRMPLNDGMGICVLTHTNVAIEEIKKRLGGKCAVLFEHPNYFGTIQGFVNKFLALPYHAQNSKNGRALIADDSHYARAIDYQLKLCIKGQKQEIFKFVTHITKSNEALKYGYRFSARKGADKIIIRKLNDKEYIPKKPRRKKQKSYIDYTDDQKSKITEYLKEVKVKLFENGIIHYDDAYYLAKRYLNRFRVANLITLRFRFLFVDEAQDTQYHQMDVISSLFGESTDKQFYGDPDQAIFSNTAGGQSAWNPKANKVKNLNISDSKRYGSSISSCLNPFKKELEHIVGNENINSENPCIILYDNPKEVLPIFIAEIKKRGLADLSEYKNWNSASSPFNALGFVGKESDNTTISSYSDNYSKSSKSSKSNFSNLISYLQKRPEEEISQKGIGVYFDLFTSALAQLIGIDGKRTAKTFLLNQLEDNHESFLKQFRLSAHKWISDIEHRRVSPEIIRNELLALLTSFGFDYVCDAFVNDNTIEPSEQIESKSNYYSADGIDVKLGTIHSVKGETHMATLLLDTQSHRESESSYFFKKDCGKLFCGEDYHQPKNYKHIEYRLKTTYVAMSRPTHLLCVALKKENADCPTCTGELKKRCKWEIIQTSTES